MGLFGGFWEVWDGLFGKLEMIWFSLTFSNIVIKSLKHVAYKTLDFFETVDQASKEGCCQGGTNHQAKGEGDTILVCLISKFQFKSGVWCLDIV